MRWDSIRPWTIIIFLFGCPLAARADEPEGSALLASVLSGSPQEKKEIPRLPESSGPAMPHDHMAIGVSYTGGQVRWNFSPRWAVEGHYQFGSADSNWGSIHSNVFGGRGYRFFYLRERLAWYVGGEGDYVTASSHSYSYQTTGYAAGTFAGLEFRVLPRLALGADIGPYVISLKEKLSGLSETGIDFVVNTAVNVYLF
jgi:hypothetical protein